VNKGLGIKKGFKFQDVQSVQNHFNALAFVSELASDPNRKIAEEDIRHLHFLLSEHLVERPGEYRQERRDGSTPPQEIQGRMNKMVEFINTPTPPITIAASVQYGFVRVCPFDSFNRRLARLLTNLILLRNGYPIIIIGDSQRDKYNEALSATPRSIFLEFITTRVQHAYRGYFIRIRERLFAKKLNDKFALRKLNYRQLDDKLYRLTHAHYSLV
jgi:Fic family protein